MSTIIELVGVEAHSRYQMPSHRRPVRGRIRCPRLSDSAGFSVTNPQQRQQEDGADDKLHDPGWSTEEYIRWMTTRARRALVNRETGG